MTNPDIGNVLDASTLELLRGDNAGDNGILDTDITRKNVATLANAINGPLQDGFAWRKKNDSGVYGFVDAGNNVIAPHKLINTAISKAQKRARWGDEQKPIAQKTAKTGDGVDIVHPDNYTTQDVLGGLLFNVLSRRVNAHVGEMWRSFVVGGELDAILNNVGPAVPHSQDNAPLVEDATQFEMMVDHMAHHRFVLPPAFSSVYAFMVMTARQANNESGGSRLNTSTLLRLAMFNAASALVYVTRRWVVEQFANNGDLVPSLPTNLLQTLLGTDRKSIFNPSIEFATDPNINNHSGQVGTFSAFAFDIALCAEWARDATNAGKMVDPTSGGIAAGKPLALVVANPAQGSIQSLLKAIDSNNNDDIKSGIGEIRTFVSRVEVPTTTNWALVAAQSPVPHGTTPGGPPLAPAPAPGATPLAPAPVPVQPFPSAPNSSPELPHATQKDVVDSVDASKRNFGELMDTKDNVDSLDAATVIKWVNESLGRLPSIGATATTTTPTGLSNGINTGNMQYLDAVPILHLEKDMASGTDSAITSDDQKTRASTQTEIQKKIESIVTTAIKRVALDVSMHSEFPSILGIPPNDVGKQRGIQRAFQNMMSVAGPAGKDDPFPSVDQARMFWGFDSGSNSSTEFDNRLRVFHMQVVGAMVNGMYEWDADTNDIESASKTNTAKVFVKLNEQCTAVNHLYNTAMQASAPANSQSATVTGEEEEQKHAGNEDAQHVLTDFVLDVIRESRALMRRLACMAVCGGLGAPGFALFYPMIMEGINAPLPDPNHSASSGSAPDGPAPVNNNSGGGSAQGNGNGPGTRASTVLVSATNGLLSDAKNSGTINGKALVGAFSANGTQHMKDTVNDLLPSMTKIKFNLVHPDKVIEAKRANNDLQAAEAVLADAQTALGGLDRNNSPIAEYNDAVNAVNDAAIAANLAKDGASVAMDAAFDPATTEYTTVSSLRCIDDWYSKAWIPAVRDHYVLVNIAHLIASDSADAGDANSTMRDLRDTTVARVASAEAILGGLVRLCRVSQ